MRKKMDGKKILGYYEVKDVVIFVGVG